MSGQGMLVKRVLFWMIFLYIAMRAFLAFNAPVQLADNGPRPDAVVMPAEQTRVSNLTPATKQADQDFLKQVVTADAGHACPTSNSRVAADTARATGDSRPALPTASLHHAETARQHPDQHRGSTSLALAGHTSAQKGVAAIPGFFGRVFRTVFRPRQ